MAKPHSTAPVLTAKQVTRFWSKIAKSEPDACWPWQGSGLRGYGIIRIKLSKRVYTHFYAHVLARYLATGEWPDGLDTCHTCDNPPCCNPAHLWLGTAADNSADMLRKGRHHTGPRPKGITQWKAAFTESEVLEIRRLYAAGGITLQQLADQHDVSKHCIHCIVTRKTWKHLP